MGSPSSLRVLQVGVGLAERGQRRAEGPLVGLDQSRARFLLRFRQIKVYSLFTKPVK